MTQKLKPCPFCNGEAEIITDAVWQSFVMCMMCGFGSSEAVLDKEALVKQWNTRHEAKREFVVNPSKQD